MTAPKIAARALVGLIGANIQSSISPLLHEDAFAALGVRGHYHLMDLDLLPGRSLRELLDAARAAGFAGVNVTYPCKEAVIPLLDAVSDEARQIGAVNTVTIDRERRTHGYNTDRIGFRRSFEDGLGRAAIAGKTAILIGAGGAGRAVAFALFDLGAARVRIRDIDTARAHALAHDLNMHFGTGRAEAIDDVTRALPDAAGIVNATPVGMQGIAGLPAPTDGIGAQHWAADVIYTPLETAFIARAAAQGARTLTGGGMCVHQAVESFRLFSGAMPDVARMKRVFEAAITARG
ncbi:MAG: shikimate dehydrogenase [Alphaproteobacteria bacterium]